MARRFAFAAIAILVGLLLPLLALEAMLRLFPVTDVLNPQPVSSGSPYARYQADRDITFSKGWNFAIVARKHVNNYGYLSDRDFTGAASSPLLAVIGDSFVEALQVPNAKSMHGLLQERAGSLGRVYGIAMSGAPLSQYLAFAEFARREFAPGAMAFVIVGNDFDESVSGYNTFDGFHYFMPGEDGTLVLSRVDYESPGRVRQFARRSALVRYLVYTVGVNWRAVLSTFRNGGGGFVGNTAATFSEQRLRDSKAAIDAFFRLLPGKSGLGRDRVLFVVDAARPELYVESGSPSASSYFRLVRAYFLDRAAAEGYETIDMEAPFRQHFRAHGNRFEFDIDGHWNALGHEIVAEQIRGSRVFSSAFPDLR